MQKKCFKCETFKDLSEFYKHKMMLDGHLNKCKDCAKFDVRKHRKENDSVREYDRKRYYQNPDRQSQIRMFSKEWYLLNPNAKKAHTAVANAIKSGKLKRQPCKKCGATKNIHGHHKDYNKVLDVDWLCVRCHSDYHNDN